MFPVSESGSRAPTYHCEGRYTSGAAELRTHCRLHVLIGARGFCTESAVGLVDRRFDTGTKDMTERIMTLDP